MQELIGNEIWLGSNKVRVTELNYEMGRDEYFNLGDMSSSYSSMGNMEINLKGIVIERNDFSLNDFSTMVDINKDVKKNIDIMTLGEIEENMPIDLKIDGVMISGLVREKKDNILRVIIIEGGGVKEIKVDYDEELLIPY